VYYLKAPVMGVWLPRQQYWGNYYICVGSTLLYSGG